MKANNTYIVYVVYVIICFEFQTEMQHEIPLQLN